MTLDELRARREEILEIVRRHGGKPDVRVFGSVARGSARPDSDIDLLIELEPGHSGFDRVHLVDDLELLLGRKVDAVSPNGMYYMIRDIALREAVPL